MMNKLFAAVLSSAALLTSTVSPFTAVTSQSPSIQEAPLSFAAAAGSAALSFQPAASLSNGFGGCFTTADSKTEAPALYSASEICSASENCPNGGNPPRDGAGYRFGAEASPSGKGQGAAGTQGECQSACEQNGAGGSRQGKTAPTALDKEATRAPGRDLPPAKADQEPVPKASVRKAEAKASVKEAARAPGREEEPDRAGQPDNTALAKKMARSLPGTKRSRGNPAKNACLSLKRRKRTWRQYALFRLY